jgi:hypothetical protein
MADCSTHNDDGALLMIRRKPDKAASGSLDSSGPADAETDTNETFAGQASTLS